LSLAWLSAQGGGGFWIFAVAVSIEGFAYAFAQVVLITYMSSLTATELAASQYALLTSLCAFPGSLLAGTSGFIIARTGFTMFFVLTSLIGIPVGAMLVCVGAARRYDARPEAPWIDLTPRRLQKAARVTAID
jgi:MFS transporter, PAT family, beta-lactamase induction signal transducer AmpG